MKTGLCIAATFFLLLVAPLTELCHSATRYTIQDLGKGVTPLAINNNGDVAGEIVSSGTGLEGFLYRNGGLTRLGKLGGLGSRAFAINDHADLLVTVCTDAACSGYHVLGEKYDVLMKDGRVTDLRLPPASLTNADRINNSGQILGFRGGDAVVLYQYQTNVATVIAQRPPNDSNYILGSGGLNDLGEAAYTKSLCGGYECAYPQLYRGGTSTPVDGNWVVTDMNDRSQITGHGYYCGYLYETGTVPLVDNAWVVDNVKVCLRSKALNDQALVIGKALLPQLEDYGPATYSNGEITLMNNTLLNSNDDWSIESIDDVNDHGQIVGFGAKNGEPGHGFILTPVAVARYPVTLTIDGTGNGAVNGAMSCVSGMSCPPVAFDQNSQVYLVASPNAYSLFGGWRGDCAISGNTCVLTINAPKSVTATFTAAPRVRIVGGGVYNSISEALAVAPTNSVIQALSAVFDEPSVTLLRPVRLTLNGGYDAGYTQQSGLSAVKGRLLIRNGTLRVNRVAVR